MITNFFGHSGGDSGVDQAFNVLSFNSNDLSLNPTEVYYFYSVICMQKMQINEKEAEMAYLDCLVFLILNNFGILTGLKFRLLKQKASKCTDRQNHELGFKF